MLPGKTLTPEDLLQILRRRIWLILVPLAVVSAATAVVARRLPNRYRSETLILVVPQRIPESYVKSTVTAKIEDRLQSITQQILSRTRLERIIEDFNLYGAERRTGMLANIVEDMRTDITVQVVKGDAFRVAYVGDNAQTVMRVTDRLASLFIEENLHDREVLAEDTNQFLEAQLEDARQRLVTHEKKLEEYRRRFSGELPSQLTSNLAAIQNSQLQAQGLVESINRDRDRRLFVERQLHDAERQIEPTAPMPVAAVDVAAAAPVGTTSEQLALAEVALATMELRLKPDHPDVQRIRRRIRELESKALSEAGGVPIDGVAAGVPGPTSPLDLARRDRIVDLRAELEQLDRQLASKQAENERLRSLAESYQQRVEKLPTRESELAELTRDYSTLQLLYATLLGKREESKIAANLERHQIGEQFKVLDPARVADEPFSPKRQLITLAGMAAGFALGLGFVLLVEYRDRTFRTDHELVKELALPVFAVVPLLESKVEQRRVFQRRLAIGCSLGTIVVGCLSVVAYTFLR